MHETKSFVSAKMFVMPKEGTKKARPLNQQVDAHMNSRRLRLQSEDLQESAPDGGPRVERESRHLPPSLMEMLSPIDNRSNMKVYSSSREFHWRNKLL